MKFHHRVHGAKFFMPDGKEICFAGGVVDTSTIHPDHREAVEHELKKIANAPASQIFTMDKPVISVEEKAVQREIAAQATQAFDQVNKVPSGAQTVEMPRVPDQVPTLQNAAGAAETAGGDALAARLAAAKAAVSSGTQTQPVSKGPVSPDPGKGMAK